VRAFEVDGMNAEEFVQRAGAALAQRDLGDVVSVTREDEELVITLTRMGTSELRFTIESLPDGFRATPGEQRISPFHAPFLGAFEQGFADVLAHLGARLA